MVAQRADWGDERKLEENKQVLREKYLRKLREFEARYEMRSAQLDAALQAGTLRETFEIDDWLITYRAYRKLGYAL